MKVSMDVIRRNSGHAQVIGNRDASTSTQSDEEKIILTLVIGGRKQAQRAIKNYWIIYAVILTNIVSIIIFSKSTTNLDTICGFRYDLSMVYEVDIEKKALDSCCVGNKSSQKARFFPFYPKVVSESNYWKILQHTSDDDEKQYIPSIHFQYTITRMATCKVNTHNSLHCHAY